MSLCGGAQATCKNNVSYHEDGIYRGVAVSGRRSPGFGSIICSLSLTPPGSPYGLSD